MDNTAACSGFYGKETKKNKKSSKGKDSLKQEEKELVAEREMFFFSPFLSRTLSSFLLPPVVEKSWRVFLAFSSPAARWKG